MAENLYLLELAKGLGAEVAKMLLMDGEPTHIRLATDEAISPYGFPPGADGWVG